MVSTKSIFIAVFCAVAQLTSAGTIPVERDSADLTLRTNGARMAAGLNPLPPRGLDRRTFWPIFGGGGHGGGNHGPPSPPAPAPSPRPPQPPKPPVKRDGKLKCKRGGVFIGWVGKDFSSKDRNKKGFGLCNSRDNALSIDFDDVDDDLDIRLPNQHDFPFLGWVGNNLGSDNSCILTKTGETRGRNSPANVGNAFQSWAANSESHLWRKVNNRFSFNWMNSGGSRTESKTFYNPDDDLFHLVSDVGRFQRKCPRAFEVELEFD